MQSEPSSQPDLHDATASVSVSHTKVEASDPLASTSIQIMTVEVGGRAGLEPTRYGDWEKNGRCIDF